MASIIKALQEQTQTFEEQALSEIDLLSLTELTYMELDPWVPFSLDPTSGVSFSQLLPAIAQSQAKKGLFKDHTSFLQALMDSPRFQNIRVFGFVNEIDVDVQKQFAAAIYEYLPQHYLLVFRGTDDSVVGWKEDFHLTYSPEIPAQHAALAYTHQFLATYSGSVILSGHSKGGNLAQYAASQLPKDLQARLTAIYTFDAPGLHESLVQQKGYQAISSKIHAYIPNDSIVGKMLVTPQSPTIVKSKGTGLLQHNLLNWETDGNSLVRLDQLTSNSIQTDQTLKAWVASLSREELRDYFDLIFGIFLEAGIEKIGDLTPQNGARLQQLLVEAKGLTSDETELIKRLTAHLIGLRLNYFKEGLSFPTFPFSTNNGQEAPQKRLKNDSDK